MPEVAVLVADLLMIVRSGAVMTLLVDWWVMVPLGLEALAVLAAGKLALAQLCAGRPVI